MVKMSAIMRFSKKRLSINCSSRSRSLKAKIEFEEQCANIKFCQHLEKSPTETLHALQRYMVTDQYAVQKHFYRTPHSRTPVKPRTRTSGSIKLKETCRNGRENMCADQRQIINILAAQLEFRTGIWRTCDILNESIVQKLRGKTVFALAEVHTCIRATL